MKKKKKLLSVFSLVFAFALLFQVQTQPVIAAGETFAQQFPNPHTAEVVADYFGKTVNDVMDAPVLATTSLSLAGTQLTSIEGFEIFQQLTHLYINNNQLTNLPQTIGQLTNLQALAVNGNLLTSLPSSLFQLSKLSYLNLDENNLTTLPIEIALLTNLTRLELSNNHLESLPASFNQLSKLTIINLSWNAFTEFPVVLTQLASLIELNVGYNSIASLPDSIDQLSHLQILYVYANNLEVLPDTIGNLSNLIRLDVFSNPIVQIPNSIGNLHNLKHLDASLTQITSLPSSIVDLQQLDTLAVGGTLLELNFKSTLETLLPTTNINLYIMKQLQLVENTPAVELTNGSDISNIILKDYVTIFVQNSKFLTPSSAHSFILQNYVDELGNSVNIDDYILNGVVLQNGILYAQIRAEGAGIFANSSSGAITQEGIKIIITGAPESLIPVDPETPDMPVTPGNLNPETPVKPVIPAVQSNISSVQTSDISNASLFFLIVTSSTIVLIYFIFKNKTKMMK